MTIDASSILTTSIAPFDLCSVFSSLIDNAIEACKKIDIIADRKIEVIAAMKQEYLIIKVKNTKSSEILKNDDGLFLSTKHDKQNHGIVKEIANRYNGTISTDYSVDNFSAVVLLNYSQN
jgi:sensor histidine kinase YesM